jgi:hypothetical protein
MRRRMAIVAASAGAALLALGAIAAFGGGDGPIGPLRWQADPVVFTPGTLPDDRILTGTLRNTGMHRLRVNLPDVRLRAADGHTVGSAPIFLDTFGKSLWSPGRGPAQYPDSELLRTGRIAWLKPGQTVPFTVGWRAADRPVRIDYGVGSLPIPTP